MWCVISALFWVFVIYKALTRDPARESSNSVDALLGCLGEFIVFVVVALAIGKILVSLIFR